MSVENNSSMKRFVITLCALLFLLIICIAWLALSSQGNNNTVNTVTLETPNDVAMSEQEAQLKEQDEKTKADAELEQQRQEAISNVIVGTLGESNSAWGVYVKGVDVAFEVDYGSHQMPSASIIKPFIATCVYDNIDELLANGNGAAGIDSLIFSMISASDNSATNSLIRMLGNGDANIGFEKVNNMCSRLGFSETHLGRLMLDMSNGEQNCTSAKDCANLLAMINNSEISGSDKILNAMNNQVRRNKIPAGIKDGSNVANKTGELSGVENDIAIISGNHTYDLCIMSDAGASSVAISLISSLAGQINDVVQGF